MKSWKTTLFGVLLGLPTLLHGLGVTVGHFGPVDILTLVQALAGTGLGLYAKDKDVTGGTVKQ